VEVGDLASGARPSSPLATRPPKPAGSETSDGELPRLARMEKL